MGTRPPRDRDSNDLIIDSKIGGVVAMNEAGSQEVGEISGDRLEWTWWQKAHKDVTALATPVAIASEGLTGACGKPRHRIVSPGVERQDSLQIATNEAEDSVEVL